MARNREGSKARRHRLHLGKRYRIFLRWLLTFAQGYGEVTIPKYPYLKPLISDYHGGPDQLGMAIHHPSEPAVFISFIRSVLGAAWSLDRGGPLEGSPCSNRGLSTVVL